MNSLDIFHPLTARWFTRAVGTPTAVQEAAWPAIASGAHTLVSAPTGTGKTLSAFLVFIDRLLNEAREGTLKRELRLIYVSPLKSLAGDIRENLRRPLEGIYREEHGGGFAGDMPGGLEIAIRTGDTPQSERRRMAKTPPHILIITPESLYLMLTSKSGQGVLRTARWIIIDELHALIDSKRGAHLMLSVARLDKLCQKPLQRIGLSATLEPLRIAAEYLAPGDVTIAAPKMHKNVRLAVTAPSSAPAVKKDAAWQDIAREVYARCGGARSAIAFVEGRAYAEKLAYYVNQLGGEGFARTHHGSLSKEQRYEVESALRGGSLRLLCATSSMELGIDVGEIDEVFQIGCPRSISSTMQRLGRAGHNPNRTSVMHIFPRAPAEALYSGLAAEVVRSGGVEYSRPPRLCLDVLAQHLVSMGADGYDVDEVMGILPRAYPFRDVTRDDVRAVLRMLAGDNEHSRDLPVRPRVLYDRIHDRVDADSYSRMLAVSAGGTIPDKGMYAARTHDGVKIGELDEEFVYEARKGDKFLLGSFAWQISDIKKDSVVVIPSTASGARPPFWKGEIKGRAIQTGYAYGAILRSLALAQQGGTLYQELCRLGLNDAAARGAEDLINRQLAATGGVLPDDRTIVVEHFRDETGNCQMMAHSVFGRPVNEPLAILATEAAKRLIHTNVSVVADDDGFLMFPYADAALPERLLYAIAPETAAAMLAAALPATPVFNMAFRYNAGRALMMGMRKTGRQPLWVQRLRGAEMLDSIVRSGDHPLIRETRRECLEDYWNLPGVEQVLNGIRAGTIRVVELHLDAPSPMSMPLRRQTEGAMMYDYAPSTQGIHAAVEDALNETRMIAPAPEQLARVSERAHLPETAAALHTLMMIEGDVAPLEMDVPIEWFEALEEAGQANYIEPGLWIAAEHTEEYDAAQSAGDTAARMRIVRRLLRYRGAHSPGRVAERYFWEEDDAQDVLNSLCREGAAVEYEGLYYHAELFNRARRETVVARRRQIQTLPAERYAAALASRARSAAPAKAGLEEALKALVSMPHPPALWESVLLPARVGGYRPELLDTVLSQGGFFWRFTDGGLQFSAYDDVEWEADLGVVGETLEGEEKTVFDALMKRGASFMQRLSDLFAGGSPQETLLRLAEKGIVTADSFAPVRHWIDREKIDKAPGRQRALRRAQAWTAGRWELARPMKAQSTEQLLERAFDRAVLLCRETAQGVNWADAVKALRVWEYTGRVRRGYFIAGMSGMQYIRESDYAGFMLALEQPDRRVVWLPAMDPAQPWGKCLAHMPGRAFLSVPGAAVALCAGVPVAVFEQQGKSLRVFEDAALPEALRLFVQEYSARRIFPALRRITLKEYPREAAEALGGAGFSSEMRDWVLYRGV